MVELEVPDAEARRAAWNTIRDTPRVHDLVDLRAITLETFTTFLLSDDEFREGLLASRRSHTSPDHVVRAYWKRVRQPRLPDA